MLEVACNISLGFAIFHYNPPYTKSFNPNFVYLRRIKAQNKENSLLCGGWGVASLKIMYDERVLLRLLDKQKDHILRSLKSDLVQTKTQLKNQLKH